MLWPARPKRRRDDLTLKRRPRENSRDRRRNVTTRALRRRRPERQTSRYFAPNVMFKLIPTMRRGSASGIAEAWARYPTIAAARLGIATLFRDDRILRVM